MADIDALRARANKLVGSPVVVSPVAEATPRASTARSTAKRRAFSAFDVDDLGRATALAGLMQVRARDAADPSQGLEAALSLAEVAADGGEPELAAHAVRLFNAHAPAGRALRLARPIESLTESLVPRAKMAFAPAAVLTVQDALSQWREDPLANEHHLHWHVVYPQYGLFRDDAPADLVQRFADARGRTDLFTDAELHRMLRYQDRHGEMFIYMHQQMLARYDAERLSLGLAPVAPIRDEIADGALPEAYDVDPVLEALDPPFLDRRPEQVFAPPRAAQLRGWKIELEAAVDARGFAATAPGEPAVAMTIDSLGANIEAAVRIFRSGADLARYGNLHNAGHGVIAALSPTPGGVMRSTAHAIRDPAFWRWHRLIDDLAFRWQEGQPALDFADRPGVAFAKGADAWSSPDILLLPASAVAGADLAARLLALPNMSAAANAGGIETLDTLTTRGRTADVRLPDGSSRRIQHLSHDPFAIAIKATNPAATAADVTLRIFLAPASQADDRRAWIEMDKITTRVAAGEAKVVVRLDREAEVVKKPVDMGPDDFVPAIDTDDARCSCGWPYTLLLPRGTAAGMPFRLLVVATDARIDGFVNVSTCGSVSFCGARDVAYPDKREMGYPFNRKWIAPITQMAGEEPSMAARSLLIRNEPAAA